MVYPRFTRVMCPCMRRAHSNINRSSFFTFHPTSPWSFSFLSFFLSLLFHVSVFCFRIQSAFSYVAESLPLYSRLKAEPFFLNFLWISFPTRDAALFSIRELAQHQKVNNVQEIPFPLSLSLFPSLSLSLSFSLLSPRMKVPFYFVTSEKATIQREMETFFTHP